MSSTDRSRFTSLISVSLRSSPLAPLWLRRAGRGTGSSRHLLRMGGKSALLVAGLLLASPLPVAWAGELSEMETFHPCATAKEVVAGTLSGEAPPDIASWPLYELELDVFPDEERIVGRMQISLSAPAGGLSSIMLMEPPEESPNEGSPLRVTTAGVRIGADEAFAPAPVDRAGLKVEISLPRHPRMGEAIVLLLSLEGRLARRSAGNMSETMGILASSYGIGRVGAIATDGTGVTLLGPHPTLADFRDGAFIGLGGAAWGPRGPAPVACHIMSVLAPPGLVSVSTGDAVGEVPEPGGRVRHTFVAAGGRRMGVLFRPSETARHERRVGRVMVRASAGQAKVAEEMTRWAGGVLRNYEERYGPYPWTKLEVVEAPMTGAMAGMRAPGIVVINGMATSGSGLAAGLGPSGMESFMQEIAIAHQLAHQWFGELIDTGGAEAPAVEEALAWHAVLDYARTRHGVEAGARIKRRMVDLAYHTFRLLGRPDAPAGASLETILEYGGAGAYVGLCDGKAPGLMEALALLIGRDNLRRALRRLSDENRFGRANRESLLSAVTHAAPAALKEGVEPLFVRWLDQAHGDEDLGSSLAAVSSAVVGELGGGAGMDEEMIQNLIEQMLQGFGGLLGP